MTIKMLVCAVLAAVGFAYGSMFAADALNYSDSYTTIKNGCVVEVRQDVWGHHLGEERVCGTTN